ncbi:MAG: AraC family transcriptional regulator [Clostridiales bacterium]|nr:AraC family transcriptional regulator [Clostridiales bacterium]
MQNTPDWIRADVGIGSILSVNLEHHEKGWRYSHSARNHGRRTSAFVLVLGGAATYRMGRKDFRAEQNDLLFLRKGMVYDSRVTEDCVYTILVVTFNFLSEEEARRLPLVWKIPLRPGGRIIELFTELREIWARGSFFYRLGARAILQQIVYELSVQSLRRIMNSDQASKILPSIEYMEQHYSRPLRLPELARQSSFSPSHFRRLFVEAFGMPPMDYLNYIRIEHAKNLIASRSYPLREVAERTGFGSPQYFSRIFRKITGVSPSRYTGD